MPVLVHSSGRAAGSLVPELNMWIDASTKQPYTKKGCTVKIFDSRSSINVDNSVLQLLFSTFFFHLHLVPQLEWTSGGWPFFPQLRFLCAHPDTFLSADFGASDS